MFYKYNLLSPVMVRHALDFYEFADFEPGMMSTGLNPDKDNLEMSGASYEEIANLLINNIVENQEFSDRYCIQGVASPLLSLYKEGHQYNYHVDNWRTSFGRNDFACTVFLSQPNEYEGGELELIWGDTVQEFKLEQGQAILYPSSTIHRVKPVTTGERKALVFWCTSYIKDPSIRHTIIELNDLMMKYEDQLNEVDKNINLSLKCIRHQLLRLHS